MKALFLTAALILAGTAHAETLNLPIEGMHCGGCTAAVEAKVCKDKKYLTCKAEVTDATKKMGKLTIETKRGEKIDIEAVKAAVTETKYVPLKAEIK